MNEEQSTAKRPRSASRYRTGYACLFAAIVALAGQSALPQSSAVENEGLRYEISRWMQIDDNPSLVLDVFTVECWLNAESRVVVVSRDKPGNLEPDWSVVFDAPRERIEFMTGMGGNPDEYFHTAAGSFRAARWNHLSVSVNGPAGLLRIYINGIQELAASFPRRNFTVSCGLAWGGYWNNALGATGNAIIDEAKYWNTERTSTQITNGMNRAQPLDDRTGLHGYWRFCSNFVDSSGFGNHGQRFNAIGLTEIRDLPYTLRCQNPCAFNFDIQREANATLCSGNGILLTGPEGQLSYLWRTGDTTRSIRVFKPGWYTLTVIDSLGCSDTDSIWVEPVDAPEVTIDKDTTLCSADSVRLSASIRGGKPPYLLQWSPTDGMNLANPLSPLVAPASTTTYILKATDAVGCTGGAAVTVRVSTKILHSLPDSIRLCQGQSVRLALEIHDGGDEVTFSWTPTSEIDSTTVQQPIVWPSGSRWYVVRMRNKEGCVVIDSILVRQSPRIQTDLPDTLTWCGDSGGVILPLRVQSGTLPYRFSWFPSSFLSNPNTRQPIAAPPVPTWFHVRVSDASGCEAWDSIYVRPRYIQPLSLSAIGATILCTGDTTLIRSDSGFVRYYWSTPFGSVESDSASLLVTIGGRYHVRAIDEFGCETSSDTLSIEVFPPRIIPISLPSGSLFCLGDSLEIQALEGFRDYAWFLNDSLPVSLERRLVIREAGRYTVHARDSAGCLAEGSTVVNSVELPQLRILGPRSVCAHGTTTYYSESHLPSRISWHVDPPAMITTSDSSATITWGNSGVYKITLRIKEPVLGCEDSISIEVDVRESISPPLSVKGPISRCVGDTLTIEVLDFWPTVRWIDGSGDTVAYESVLRITSSGVFRAIVRSGDKCEGMTDSVVVAFFDPPLAWIEGETEMCAGDTLEFHMRGRFSGLRWDIGTATMLSPDTLPTIRITSQKAGELRIGASVWTQMDSLRCTSDQQIVLRVHDVPHPRIIGPTELCEGDSVILSVDGAFTNYLWSNGHTEQQQIIRTAGDYFVTVTNEFGCVSTSSHHSVRVLPRPEKPKITVLNDTLVATQAHSYQWFRDGLLIPGATNQTFAVTDSGTYQVEIANEYGCSAISDTVSATGLHAFTVVSLPHLIAWPGDTVNISLTLSGSTHPAGLHDKTFRAIVRFDKTMLAPLSGYASSVVLDSEREIEIRGSYGKDAGILASFTAVATLGRYRKTTLFLDRFEWDDPDLLVARIHGSFETGICEEGGARLVATEQRVQLHQNSPNPFNYETEIDFTVIESGNTELRIVDGLGRTVQILQHGNLGAGRHRAVFNAAELPSGIYYCVLSTPTLRLIRSMILLK